MLHADNEHRNFILVELRSGDTFHSISAEWLRYAEGLHPKSPKALLDERLSISLPDGTRFIEISYKREHIAVHATLGDWFTKCGRLWGRVEGPMLKLCNGIERPIDSIQVKKT